MKRFVFKIYHNLLFYLFFLTAISCSSMKKNSKEDFNIEETSEKNSEEADNNFYKILEENSIVAIRLLNFKIFVAEDSLSEEHISFWAIDAHIILQLWNFICEPSVKVSQNIFNQNTLLFSISEWPQDTLSLFSFMAKNSLYFLKLKISHNDDAYQQILNYLSSPESWKNLPSNVWEYLEDISQEKKDFYAKIVLGAKMFYKNPQLDNLANQNITWWWYSW